MKVYYVYNATTKTYMGSIGSYITSDKNAIKKMNEYCRQQCYRNEEFEVHEFEVKEVFSKIVKTRRNVHKD